MAEHRRLPLQTWVDLIERSAGDLLWIGAERPEWLPAFAAANARVDLLPSGASGPGIKTRLLDLGIDESSVLGLDDAGLPRLEHAYGGLVITDLPPGIDALAWLERALEHLGHDGLLLVDLPSSHVHPVRWKKLAQAGSADLEDAPSNSRERIAFKARRHNPNLPILSDQGTLRDLAALVMVEEDSEPAIQLVAEILFRQLVLPEVLVVVDHSRDSNVVPDDLWGMAPHAPIPCGLLRNEGRGVAAGLSVALDAVQTRQVWWGSPGCLPAPAFVRYLSDTLELSELDLVLCDRIRCDDSGQAIKLESPRPRSRSLEKALRKGKLSWQGGIVMSRDAIDRVGGPDAEAGDAALDDLVFRVAGGGPGGVVPLPLILA